MSTPGQAREQPSAASGHVRVCPFCPLRRLCLPATLSPSETLAFDSVVRRLEPLARGRPLHRPGDDFQGIHIVRAGALKVYAQDDGVPVTTAFRLPGEIFGLGALDLPRHPAGAIAVDTTSLCFVPRDDLLSLSQSIPALHRRLLELLSRDLRRTERLLRLFARRTAIERVAALLLSVSDHHARRGLSSCRLHLPLARNDVADYLGLAPETLSRVLATLQSRNTVRSAGHDFELLDLPRLRALAGRGDMPDD